MCRVLAYMGRPVVLDDLLFQPDCSLVRQTIHPRMLHLLNLAGFGLVAWDARSHHPEQPYIYRSTDLPIFDRNLKALAEKLTADAVIAHIRGVPYHNRVTVGEQNLHPFRFDGVPLALAHNGDLAGFDRMRYALVPHMKPDVASRIRGNTDSEWIYALLLSQLDDPTRRPGLDRLRAAVVRTLSILREVRQAHGLSTSSATNLFIGDGQSLVVVRFTFDFGCYDTEDAARLQEAQLNYLSLWYTTGQSYGCYDGEWRTRGGPRRTDAVLVSSEPLTQDVSSWMEVPEYALLWVDRASDGHQTLGTLPLEV